MKSYFSANGILHQTSCVGTPQQNDRAERKHRHILIMAMALLFQSNLPKKFWGESVLTASYLINRTPTPLFQSRTPYELLYGSPPPYSKLSLPQSVFCKTSGGKNNKIDPRSRRCVFLGYPQGQNGWKV